jgi:hypothetical protein
MRLAQLIQNVHRGNIYYMEDYNFIDTMEQFYGQAVDTREE